MKFTIHNSDTHKHVPESTTVHFRNTVNGKFYEAINDVIEINTIEELITLSNKYGMLIFTAASEEHSPYDGEIEIYNGYIDF